MKTAFNQLSSPKKFPKWVNQVDELPHYKVVAKKVRASNIEVSENIRSRSAIMRVLEKVT